MFRCTREALVKDAHQMALRGMSREARLREMGPMPLIDNVKCGFGRHKG